MPDRTVSPARSRVALVASDAESVGHLRAAVADHVEVVYAASAAEFDDARLRASGATAALVNLDGGDWLDAVERRLTDAGLAVVFNDPETSGKLAGWEQARWLRHLTAKLRGSSDYDPPRPSHTGVEAVPVATANDPSSRPAAAIGAFASTAEAEAAHVGPGIPTVAASREESSDMQPPAAVDLIQADAAPSASPDQPDLQPDVQAEEAAPLDLDTAALSAMIDARLAEPEHQQPPESTEVWRVAGDDVVAADAQADGALAAAPAAPVAAPVEEKDVLKGLPSVDDWQLVDPEAPLAATGPAPQQSQPEPLGTEGFAGLELVPLETTVAVERSRNIEPIERWMRVESPSDDPHGEPKQSAAGAGGDAA